MADDEAELRQTHAQNMSDLDALTKKLQQSLQGHNDFASSQPIEASGFAQTAKYDDQRKSLAN